MQLNELLSGVVVLMRPQEEIEITSIAFDSRKVEKGSLFCCIPGTKTDGHDYAKMAMERGAAARRMCHEEAAAVLAAHLDAGRDTAMVCLGDTSVYASSSYFLALLRERGYAVKQIPGVPSFCAAAAALGRSLTEMDAPLHIVPAGTTDLEEALAWPGSKVLMKSGEEYGRALQMLRDKGLDDRAALAVNCGLPEEMLCATLRCAPARSGYFTTFLVPADADDASS